MRRFLLFASVLSLSAIAVSAVGACNTAELSYPPLADGSGDYSPDARFEDSAGDAPATDAPTDARQDAQADVAVDAPSDAPTDVTGQ